MNATHALRWPHALRWFAVWCGDGGGRWKDFATLEEARAARTGGTNEPADCIMQTTRAELDRYGDYARTFR